MRMFFGSEAHYKSRLGTVGADDDYSAQVRLVGGPRTGKLPCEGPAKRGLAGLYCRVRRAVSLCMTVGCGSCNCGTVDVQVRAASMFTIMDIEKGNEYPISVSLDS